MATVASAVSAANQDLIESVVEVTGSSQAEAQHLLAACANDVEAAVALFFEQGAPASNEASNDALPTIPADLQQEEEDEVRAPIAPIREQLIGPEDDNFYAAAPALPGRMSTRATTRVKVCPFRDFAREGAMMEDELQAAAASLESVNASSSGGTRNRRRARAAAMVSSAIDRKTRLDDLFRPPTDIAYVGSFQTARLRATELKHWLLVNVQSDSFDSQVLNRDVWADKEVRKLIRRQFMLWQVDADTSEGRRFVAFYHCTKLPYVCVIDPRTGEEIWRSVEPKQSNVLQNLQQYLRDHNDFSQEIADSNPTTSKRSTECITIDDDEAGDADGTDTGCSARKRAKVVELSEEEQIALAIRNSIRENGAKETLSDDDDNNDNELDNEVELEEDGSSEALLSAEEFGENDAKGICEKSSYEMHLGESKTELTMLKLRLINEKEMEEVVQLRWPSDTKVKVLHMYIRQHFPNIPKKGYKLICAFPRKTLESEHNGSSLKDMSLHPSANLHVTLDD